ncbi:MAG: exo-beta-N-acetylmuramidase NamZ domain-containing protein [Acidaminococcaceae bacterium]
MKIRNMILVIFCLLAVVMLPILDAEAKEKSKRVVLGIERIEDYTKIFTGKRVGLITNQTGVTHDLKSSVDLLRSKVNLQAIFVPEHGLFGAVTAGDDVKNDNYEGIEVRSLYGDTRRPSKAMLSDIDILAFDIQDVGTRHYTYVSTMAYAMEACAKEGKKFIVFDRPNPLGGNYEGPTLKNGFESFIGLYNVPLRHGLTVGEYARFINKEYQIGADLTVIPMKNWTREMLFEQTGLPWIATSPNIPTEASAFCYAATGIVGDMNISVGIGTTKPFEYVGAPWLDKMDFAAKLNALQMPGVIFRPIAFMPNYGMYAGELCQGVQMHITDKRSFQPAHVGAQMVRLLMKDYSQIDLFPKRSSDGFKIDIALGESSLRYAEIPLEDIFNRWGRENAYFAEKVQPYLLYPLK